ncbi:hypothetical protein [Saccharopolyspora sp. SCSIO 74807]|uniref:hypothetical protein n=1 Tax=Saccharopolyspora sp. SCSIO 74807 TaxID=3118084 RepID=UPI0030D43C98
MLRAISPQRGRTAFLAMFALSAFLLCILPLHHSHVTAAALSGPESVSAATAQPMAPGQTGDSASASSTPQDGHSEHHDHHSAPVCHATSTHFVDVVKPLQGMFPGLPAALLVAAVGATLLDRQARARWWSTRPPGRLSGFSLLLTLGVSRT